MSKAFPEYERSVVNAAGIRIVAGDGDDRDYQVFNNWRACHNYPLNTFQASLRDKINRMGIKSSIVSQRLKREESIVAKLKREPQMKLSQMQDIGGLRAVVSTINDVAKLKDSFLTDRSKHKVTKINDYINNPKTSGYRSTHLIFKYKNKRAPKYDDIKIEIQLRTKLQHYWANAVETMGTYLKESLKSSQGSEKWLRFFTICGEIFARKERTASLESFLCYSNDEMISMCSKHMVKLNAVSILSSFSGVTSSLTDKKWTSIQKIDPRKTTHLIQLDLRNNIALVSSYLPEDQDSANEDYAKIERRIREGESLQAVLVNMDSIKALKRAYPSYFLDAQGFLRELRAIDSASKTDAKYFHR